MKKSLIFIFSLLLCVTNVGYIHAEDELPSEVPESSEVEHDEESLNDEHDDVLDEASIESDEEQVLEETTETLDTDNWDVDNVVQDEQDSLDSLNDEESIINVETNVEDLEIDSLVEEDALDTAPEAGGELSEEEALLTTSENDAVLYLDKDEFKTAYKELAASATSVKLYFGNTNDYDLSSLSLQKNLSNNYYVYTSGSDTLDVYLLAGGDNKVVFPENSKLFFYGLNDLTNITFKNVDTSNVTDMYAMFYQCQELESLDLSSFDTTSVTNMQNMFRECSKLTSLNLSSFNTSKVTNMSFMFNRCYELSSLDLSNFDTSNITSMRFMFGYCRKLTSLNISNFDTSKVTDMYATFNECKVLTSLDVSKFKTSNVTTMSAMFAFCYNLDSLDVSKFDTSNVTDMSNMFAYCESLPSLNLSNFNTSKVENMKQMFAGMCGLSSIDISSFNTSNVTNMYNMFWCDELLTSLDLSNFNTSNVTTMKQMFWQCSGLTSLNISNFNTSKVTDMYKMFNGCQSLTSLNVSSFNTSNVTNMSYMFAMGVTNTTTYKPESALTTLTGLENFDTSKVTNMSNMFQNCGVLTSLDLSYFNTSKVTDMSSMFYNCVSLTSLDLSFFNTASLAKLTNMFGFCSKLTTIYASELFNVPSSATGDNVFIGCSSLVGGEGTTLDSYSKTSKKYAKIDGGTSDPGYFTKTEKTHEHTWNSGEYTTEPTCTTKGSMLYTCTRCGETKTEEVKALGHEFSNEWTIDIEPTCTTSGEKSYHCIRCTGSRKNVTTISPTGHSYSSWNVTKDATCEENGSREKVCSKCNDTVTEVITKLGHSYSTEWTTDVEPTCAKEGSKSHHCTRTNCDSKSNVTPIAKVAHTWNTGEITTAPKCETNGIKTYTCTVCGGTYTKTVSALGHSFTAEVIKAEALKTAGTCIDKAVYIKSCKNCGQVDTDTSNTFVGTVDSTNHNYSAWKVTKEATCTENGSREKVCSRCDNKVTETIAKIAHSYSTEWTIDQEATTSSEGSKSHHCTKCGAKTDVTVIPKLISFIDVDSSTDHNAAIMWLAGTGISKGWSVPNGLEFRPYATVKRCDMSAFLKRLAGVLGDKTISSYTPSNWNRFVDVAQGDGIHEEDILWLADNEISTGWKDGTFRPLNDVTRADMAAFLRRLAKKNNIGDAATWTPSESDWATFSDLTRGDDYHQEDILWLAHAGISQGWSMKDGTKEFRPMETVKRCDMAAFLQRLANLASK